MSAEWLEVGYIRDAVSVARAALCEVGRRDIADRVYKNRAGWPSVEHGDEDRAVIVKAFWLGHIAMGHRARITRDFDDGVMGIDCPECWRFNETHR